MSLDAAVLARCSESLCSRLEEIMRDFPRWTGGSPRGDTCPESPGEMQMETSGHGEQAGRSRELLGATECFRDRPSGADVAGEGWGSVARVTPGGPEVKTVEV